MSFDKPVIVIGGCTASGKSGVAIELAKKLPSINHSEAEVLCADSVTIYKGFDIGSAKLNSRDQSGVRHHLLDIRSGQENFTAGDFVESAEPLIHDLHQQGKIPILVGGTGFYIRALLQGMTEESPEESSIGKSVKLELEQELVKNGITKLYEEMLTCDPALKEKIHFQDHYRVIRALQAMRSTGKRWSELNELAKSRAPKFSQVYFFCLDIEKEQLRKNIHSRTKKMLLAGLIEETKSLLDSGIPPNVKPMQSIGYKQVVDFLEGNISRDELGPAIELATMRLAKQQRTWFRGEKKAYWVKNLSDITQVLMLGLAP